MALFLIFALIVAFFAIAFALQNDQLITINFFIWQLERQHLATVLLATSGLGVLFGLLVTIPAFLKREWRISRGKRQTHSLEDQLLAKQTELDTQTRHVSTLRRSHQTLLHSLDLLDNTTGLIHTAALSRATRSQLQQMHQSRPTVESLGLLIVHPHPQSPVPDNLAKEQALQAAIAQVLQRNLTTDAWVFSDGHGQFTCSLPGRNVKELNQQAETLRAALTDTPLTLTDGSQTTVEVSIGGAVTDAEHPTESEQLLLQKAQESLALAQKRGRNRGRVVWVTD